MSRSHPNSWHHLLRGQRYEWPHYTHSSMDEWTWSHLNDRCAWTTELVAEGMCKIGVSHVPSESSELDHLCLLKCNHLTFWSVGAFHLDKQEHSSLILCKPLVSIQSGCRNLQWTGKNPREVRSIKTWRPGEEPYRAWTPPPPGGVVSTTNWCECLHSEKNSTEPCSHAGPRFLRRHYCVFAFQTQLLLE